MIAYCQDFDLDLLLMYTPAPSRPEAVTSAANHGVRSVVSSVLGAFVTVFVVAAVLTMVSVFPVVPVCTAGFPCS